MNKITQSKWFDFFIICARILLAFTFIRYGWGKLTEGGQFGLKPEELNTPIKDLSLFRISWYLFDHQPFKYTIGILQIICSLLLLFNRTVIFGTLLFIVLISNILLIDETVMPEAMKLAFRDRLLFYIFLCFLILYHYRERFFPAIKIMLSKYNIQYKHKLWLYIFVPFGVIFLEIFTGILKTIYLFVTDFRGTTIMFREFFSNLIENFT